MITLLLWSWSDGEGVTPGKLQTIGITSYQQKTVKKKIKPTKKES